MNSDLADLIKLLAHIAVEKYYDEVTQLVELTHKQHIDKNRKNSDSITGNDRGLQG